MAFTCSRLLPVSSQQLVSGAAINLSVRSSINTVFVLSFCVGVFYSAPPLF